MNKKILVFAAAVLLSTAVVFPQSPKPKNIILLIGDGMGLNVATTSVIFLDNNQFNRFPFCGLVVTCSADNLITDSAAGGTAYAAGERTKNGSISVDTTGKVIPTVLEYAKSKGLATGLVVTSSITDATPAVFYSHVTQRAMQSEIVEFLLKGQVDLIIGGGRNYFLSKALKGSRKDEKNILDSLKARGYKVALTYDEIGSIGSKDKFAAILDNSNLPKAVERNYTLGALTEDAIKRLSQNKKGFFLMVEGSQIDKVEHNNDWDNTVTELKDFNTAVKAALDFAQKDKNTLVIVVADHETGGLSITGGNFAKPVVSWTTKGHTASMIGVFAYGPGSNQFTGVIDNYLIGRKIFTLLGKKLAK